MRLDTTTMTRREALGAAGIGAMGTLLALAGCGSSASSGSEGDTGSAETTDAATVTDEATGSVLVAYYSATGNTRAVAERLADDLGADLFEVEPEEPYTDDDLNFNDDSSRVVREHEDESQRDVPLAQVTPDGFEGYDTVLVGYPIWWGEAAWPIDGFVSGNDFGGKRVITFCTSQASGIGDTTETLSALAGTGDWEEGQRFSEDPDEAEVDDWSESLGL